MRGKRDSLLSHETQDELERVGGLAQWDVDLPLRQLHFTEQARQIYLPVRVRQ